MKTEKSNKTIYDIKYQKEKLKRIPLNVQLDYYNNVLRPAAEKSGLPVNTFIKQAIAEKIQRDKLQ